MKPHIDADTSIQCIYTCIHSLFLFFAKKHYCLGGLPMNINSICRWPKCALCSNRLIRTTNGTYVLFCRTGPMQCTWIASTNIACYRPGGSKSIAKLSMTHLWEVYYMTSSFPERENAGLETPFLLLATRLLGAMETF